MDVRDAQRRGRGGNELREPLCAGGRPAFGLKFDSCLTSPASSAGSTPLRFAAAVISEAKGVPAGSSLAPVTAPAALAEAVAAGAGPRADESWAANDEEEVVGASGDETRSVCSSSLTRAAAAEIVMRRPG